MPEIKNKFPRRTHFYSFYYDLILPLKFWQSARIGTKPINSHFMQISLICRQRNFMKQKKMLFQDEIGNWFSLFEFYQRS